MPLVTGKYDNVKVSRPRGTPYAVGRQSALPSYGKYQIGTRETIGAAIKAAFENFSKEFNRWPDESWTVIEVVCSTSDVTAVVYEIKE